MASGSTTTTALADSLPSIISDARIVREHEGVMPNLCDKKTLGKGEGVSWTEVKFDALTAQSVSETTSLDNAQQIADSAISITPTVVNILPLNPAICGNALKHLSPNQRGTVEVICG